MRASNYLRAAAHTVHIEDRVGERLARVARESRYPYTPAEPLDYLADWLHGLARMRLARVTARARVSP